MQILARVLVASACLFLWLQKEEVIMKTKTKRDLFVMARKRIFKKEARLI